MIEVLSQGRLGNQMFQFAFGYAASKKLGTTLLMRNSHLRNYFYLGMPYSIFHLRNHLLAFLMERRQKPTRIVVENESDPHEVLKTLRDNTVYSGYYQSEIYFKDYKLDIIRLFKVLPEHKKKFIHKYGELFSQHKIIAIHIRRKDYTEFPLFNIKGGALLPFEYFWYCLHCIASFDTYKVIFVSDEIDVVKREFSTLENAMFESNDAIVDFQIIKNADEIIISNSSFSWWAAYLNQKNAAVFVPKHWLGFSVQKEYPVGAVVDKWRKVDVSKSI